MALNASPISRNLRTSIRLLGLDIEDLMALGSVSIFSLIVGQWIFPSRMTAMGLPMNWFCFFFVLVVGLPGLLIFKYGKPRGYLQDFIIWNFKPRHYSPFGRDSVIKIPYVIDTDIEVKKSKGGK